MFIQEKHVFQGTASFVRKADSYDPSDTGWFFRPYEYLRTNVSSAYTTFEYPMLHDFVFHKDAIPGVNVTWYRRELYDRIELDPDEVIVPDWWSPTISMDSRPAGTGGKCSLGWNHMSDGAWVMDSALATVTEEAFTKGPVLPSQPVVSFRGAEYRCEVLDCGSASVPTGSSDWQKYIADSGDATEEAWGVEKALATSGYVGDLGGNSVNARRLGSLGSVSTSWYCDSPGITYGAAPYQAPIRWVLKPTGDAPVITPDTMDMGRLVDARSFDVQIASQAALSVTFDGVLEITLDVAAGTAPVDMSEVWDALAPGWHDVEITAENDGYRCAAKRTFVKGFSETSDGSEREGMPPRYLLYSRWGAQLGDLRPRDVVHRQEVNGEDSLEFSCDEALAKGDRVLWHDGRCWREHCVVGIDQFHGLDETFSYHCETTMLEDLGSRQLASFSASGSAASSLARLLEGTPWSVGEVDVEGAKDASWEKKDAYELLMEMAGLYGAEVYPSLVCDAGGVVSRKVNMVASMGSDKGARFEYSSNLEGIQKTVLDDKVYSAVVCYGADGLSVRVEDPDALLLWGLPDGRGGVTHTEGRYEDASVESEEELRSAGESWLSARSTPQVSYRSSVPFAELEGVSLGDTVQVRDNDFTPPLRLFARVGAMERNLSTMTTSDVTFGNVVSVLPDVLARQYDSIRVVSSALEGISPSSMMSGMNALYANGGSNVCMTAEGGIITANVRMDDEGRPLETSGQLTAVQLSGGSVRTATSVGADGNWEWQDSGISGGA